MHTATVSATRPAILDAESLDLLETYESVEVRAKNLREGMVLVDEFGFAIAMVDHRVRAPRNSGGAHYLVWDYEGDKARFVKAEFHGNRLVRVAAR